MVLSRADIAGMAWTTPTALAEEVYRKNHPAKTWPSVRGPAGIDIPDPRSTYRPTIEGPLLNAIAAAAHRAHVETLTPRAVVAQVAVTLAEHLVTMFPPTDMAVLARYGKAREIVRLFVNGGRLPHYKLDLAQPVTVPDGEGAFRFPGDRGNGLVVPAQLLPFFDRVIEGQDGKQRDFMHAVSWPGQSKAKNGVWPTWAQIGAAFPNVGAWMAQQREAAHG